MMDFVYPHSSGEYCECEEDRSVSSTRLFIAGLTIDVHCSEGTYLRLGPRIRRFTIVPSTECAQATIFYHPFRIRSIPEAATLCIRSLHGSLYSLGSIYWLRSESGHRRGMEFVARIEVSQRKADIFAGQNGVSEASVGDPIFHLDHETILSSVFHLLMSARAGAVLHAAGIAMPSQSAAVFIGKSGAGKSTLTGLFEGVAGYRILGDERIVVWSESGVIWCAGSPWQRIDPEFISPGPTILEHLCILKKGAFNRLEPASAAEALACLSECTSVGAKEPDTLLSRVRFLSTLVAELKNWSLIFRKDPPDVGCYLAKTWRHDRVDETERNKDGR